MAVNSLNQFPKLQNNSEPAKVKKPEIEVDVKKPESHSLDKKEDNSMTSAYWTAAAALAATVIGGVWYAMSGKGNKAVKQGGKAINEGEEMLSEAITRSGAGDSFKSRALDVQSKALELIKRANQVKNDIIAEFAEILNKDGFLDKSKIKNPTENILNTDNTRPGLWQRFIEKRPDGIERHYEVMEKDSKITSITDFKPVPNLKHPKRTREIIFNTSTNEPSWIKIINDDNSCVEYSYPCSGRIHTSITNINSFDRNLNETVFEGNDLVCYQEGSKRHYFSFD